MNEWPAELVDCIERMQLDHAAAQEGYGRLTAEIIRLQVDFERDGVYASKTEADTWEGTYQSAKYMESTYLPGLLLSWYLWPHQSKQLDFFRKFYVKLMPPLGRTWFYDVGVGTGIYSRIALQSSHVLRGVGYDISPAALAFARRHLKAYGVDVRYQYLLADVRKETPHPLPFLVCVDLLEHLEDPAEMLRTLRKMCNGTAFIATAINAPNRDHVYLFRSAAEVIDLLHETGWKITSFQSNQAEVGQAEVCAFICE